MTDTTIPLMANRTTLIRLLKRAALSEHMRIQRAEQSGASAEDIDRRRQNHDKYAAAARQLEVSSEDVELRAWRAIAHNMAMIDFAAAIALDRDCYPGRDHRIAWDLRRGFAQQCRAYGVTSDYSVPEGQERSEFGDPGSDNRMTLQAIRDFWRTHDRVLLGVPKRLYDELDALIRADERYLSGYQATQYRAIANNLAQAIESERPGEGIAALERQRKQHHVL